MNLSSYRRMVLINTFGYFQDCFFKPNKLDKKLYPYYEQSNFLSKQNKNKQGTFHNYYCEVTSVDGKPNSEPCYCSSCSFWNCSPMAIEPRTAKKRALFIRKYGEKTYYRKYMSKPNKRLQNAMWWFVPYMCRVKNTWKYYNMEIPYNRRTKIAKAFNIKEWYIKD